VNNLYRLTATISDQFGDEMALPPAVTWSIAAGGPRGSIDAAGNFFPQAAGDFKITATVPGGPSGSATVTVGAAESVAPAISNITRSAITQDSATIQWFTNDAADSQIEYGFDMTYGSAKSDGTLGVVHKIVLTGLAPGRVYHYHVRSKNAAGKEAVSDDLTFTTMAARPVRGR